MSSTMMNNQALGLASDSDETQPMKNARNYRLTVRTRLALTYSALLTGSGLVMMSIIYVFMRFVPTYDLVPSNAAGTTPSEKLPDVELPFIPGSGITEAETSTPAAEILITSTDQMLNMLLVVSAIVLVVLAVIGIGVGWAVAGQMLKPLQYINTAVHKAAHGNLQHRIALSGPRDEIMDLATNFDDMLAKLDQSFAASKRFASNASHELLTPLATSKAMLDVALASGPNAESQKLYERLLMMNNRSIETAEALIALAKIEASTIEMEAVPLESAVHEAVELCTAEAESHQIILTTELEAVNARCEPVLLRQLLTNLIHNAIRHNLPEPKIVAASNGDVTDRFVGISTRFSARNSIAGSTVVDEKTVQIIVENSGVVLSDEMVASLTEPFVRSTGRQASTAEGNGIGLAIVTAIVERFDGALELSARQSGGLRVVVTLPAA